MRRTLLADFESSTVDADFVAGADEAREKVERFVQGIADNSEIEGDVHLELAQLGAGSTMSLQSWLFSQGDEPSTVAAAIVDAAIEHGSEVSNGKTKYKITIKGFRGQCAFSLEYSPTGEDDVNEVPNGMGLVAQALKHTEKAWTMVTEMMKQSQHDHRDERKSYLERIRTLEGGQIEVVQTLASLYDSKHVRDLEVKKLEKSESRKDEVAGFLMQGIPHVINKVIGMKAVAEPSTPLEMMLHGLLSTFKNEQLQEMVQTGVIRLEKPQMMGMLEIFKAVQEKHEAREAAAHASSNGAPPPAAETPAGAPQASGP
jgi:hypothetical protein